MKLLKINEVTQLLNVHANTLRNWDNSGYLKAIRIGKRGDRRWTIEDINKLTMDKSVAE